MDLSSWVFLRFQGHRLFDEGMRYVCTVHTSLRDVHCVHIERERWNPLKPIKRLIHMSLWTWDGLCLNCCIMALLPIHVALMVYHRCPDHHSHKMDLTWSPRVFESLSSSIEVEWPKLAGRRWLYELLTWFFLLSDSGMICFIVRLWGGISLDELHTVSVLENEGHTKEKPNKKRGQFWRRKPNLGRILCFWRSKIRGPCLSKKLNHSPSIVRVVCMEGRSSSNRAL